MIPFPVDEIRDEESALAWWEHEFADCCESLSGHVDGAALVRKVVGSIRNIRSASLDELLTVAQAARETGYLIGGKTCSRVLASLRGSRSTPLHSCAR
jgi:hypothetical protein